MVSHLTLQDLSVVKPYVQSGQLLALGVSSERRNKAWDYPTLSESGLAGYSFEAWYAVLSPNKTPVEIINRLNKALEEAMSSPEVQEKWNNLGVELVSGSAQEATAYILAEHHKWQKVVKEANITPEP